MTNKYDLWAPVKSEAELIKRVKHQERVSSSKLLDLFKMKRKGLLVRAINQGELYQLLQDGPDNFLFHKGANFNYGYAYHVQTFAKARSGTIIVYDFNINEIELDWNDKWKEEDIRDSINFIFGGGDRGHCFRDIYVPVEVYNDREWNWKKLEKEKRELLDCDEFYI